MTLINVALVGRNSIVREGLCRILGEEGFEVAASVPSVEALQSAIEPGPRGHKLLVIADVGGDDVLEGSVATIHAYYPDARVVLLADQFDFDAMLCVFQEGAHGYIVKEISCERLIASLHLAATGEKVLPSQLADRLPAQAPAYVGGALQNTIESAQLSDRETEILRCLIMGCPNKVISRQLNISEATVKVHVKAILRKIRVHNRTQAAIWAVNRGLEGISSASDGRAPASAEVAKLRLAHSAVPAHSEAVASGHAMAGY